MTIIFNPTDISILLGCQLTFSGRPFHRIAKQVLQPIEEITLDRVRDDLIRARQSRPSDQQIQIDLDKEGLHLLLIILSACMLEIGNDPIDLWLHLSASSIEQVISLRDKIVMALS